MNPQQILEQARDALTVRRVFGDPIERDGIVLIPVARVRGTAGAGGGQGKAGDDEAGAGSGGGWGLAARPVGAYVIRDGEARWRPAVDVNRVILGGQVVMVIGLLVMRSVLRRRRRR